MQPLVNPRSEARFAGPLAAASFVAIITLVYGLSESLATHRVAIAFDVDCLVRVAAVACTLGAAGLLSGLAASWASQFGAAALRWVVLFASAASAGCYMLFGTAPHVELAVLVVAIASASWVIAGRRPTTAGWLAFLPLAGVSLAGVPADPWLLAMALAVVAGGTQVLHGAIETRLRSGLVPVLIVVVAMIAALAPWPLATHYGELKVSGTLLCASIGASLAWRLSRAEPPVYAAWLVTIVLLCGVAEYSELLRGSRAQAFGPYSVDTLVGQAMLWHHEAPRLDTWSNDAVAECPNVPEPTGVVWIVIDTLRADAFTPEEHPILADWAAQSTRFTRAYSPANSTFSSFASWLPRTPEDAGVPWKTFSTEHEAKLAPQLGSDIPNVTVGAPCGGEGAQFAAALDEAPPGGLAVLYFPVAHAPYLNSSATKSDAESYREGVACVVRELAPVFAWATENPDWAVVVTSDHGESMGEKGVKYHGIALWEEQVRVPLYVRAPGWAAGREVDTPVSNATLSGTFGCWLGQRADLFGGSAGVLTDSPEPRAFAIHGFSLRFGHPNPIRESAVVDGHFKLIVDHDTDWVQLFDLARDGDESENLAAAQPARVDAMRRTLAGLWGPAAAKR